MQQATDDIAPNKVLQSKGNKLNDGDSTMDTGEDDETTESIESSTEERAKTGEHHTGSFSLVISIFNYILFSSICSKSLYTKWWSRQHGPNWLAFKWQSVEYPWRCDWNRIKCRARWAWTIFYILMWFIYPFLFLISVVVKPKRKRKGEVANLGGWFFSATSLPDERPKRRK